MRKLPETIQAVSEGMSHSRTLHKATCDEYTIDFDQAEMYRYKAIASSRRTLEALANYLHHYNGSSTNQSRPYENEANRDEFERNVTATERGENEMFQKIKEGIHINIHFLN